MKSGLDIPLKYILIDNYEIHKLMNYFTITYLTISSLSLMGLDTNNKTGTNALANAEPI